GDQVVGQPGRKSGPGGSGQRFRDGRIGEPVDDMVAKLIVTKQPVAKDLRRLIAAMKIAADMERMADYACNIARVTLRLVESGQPLFKKLEDIPRMARITQQMVHDGINSYIDGNVELSKQLAQRDDEVARKSVV